MAGIPEAQPFPDAVGSSPRSTFQLQTSAIRNSTPFKSKSVDVFGSLETMERDYNSAVSGRGLGADGGQGDDDADTDEEGFIKRGCIFKKPCGSTGTLSHKGCVRQPGSSVTPESQTESFRGRRHDNKASSPSATSLDTLQSDKVGTPGTSSLTSAQQQSPKGGGDKTLFCKPVKHITKDVPKDVGRCGHFGRRGRGRPNLNFAPGGRRRAPDHVLNPHKYTEYSLEETSMCGNSTNRSVAVGFLSELRKRKKQEDADQAAEQSCAEGHFVFQKPTTPGTVERAEHSAKNKAYGSVYKMPEYEVGIGSGPKNKKTKVVCQELDQTGGGEHGRPEPCIKPDFSLDHLQGEQPIGVKEQGKADASVQSDISGPSGNVDTDQSEHGASTGEEGTGFKIRKGKGRRQFRVRQEDDT